jgi:hypothetical protein
MGEFICKSFRLHGGFRVNRNGLAPLNLAIDDRTGF